MYEKIKTKDVKRLTIEDEKSESKSHFLDYGPNFG